MRFLIFFGLLLCHFALAAQMHYEKIFYGQLGSAFAREDSTGNIIVSFPDDSTIVKYDSALNVIWSKQYHFTITMFEILENGNYICAGAEGSVSHNIYAMLNPNGDTIWTR